MLEKRRSFIKKALGVGALAVAGTKMAIAHDNKEESTSNGVVVGKSRKKEVLYKETQEWEDFFKSSY